MRSLKTILLMAMLFLGKIIKEVSGFAKSNITKVKIGCCGENIEIDRNYHVSNFSNLDKKENLWDIY